MTKRADRLQLGAMLVTFPGGSWRYPAAENHRFLDLSYYIEVAQALERGGFDFIFFADKLAVPDRPPDNTENSLRKGTWGSAAPDPAMIVAALAASTQRIGLAYTISTSYQHPYNVARSLGTLDHLSGGRAAWNVVTSHEDAEAQNFGLDEQLERSDRYDRAEEFLETVFGLWDTWEDGAVVHDVQRNVVIDPEKVHALNHQGEHFQVRGPLNLPRPPQGYPVIAQAGSSEKGREFAARWAEVIFTPQPNIESAQAFYRDVKSRMAKYNRKEDELKILPGVFVIVGETETIALEKESLLQEGVDLKQAMAQLSALVETDLRNYPADEPAAPILAKNLSVKGMQGHVQALHSAAVKDKLTLAQLARRIATGLSFAKFVGTAERIADQIEEWFEAYACDGFIIRTAYSPGMSEFARLVMPELRRRNLVRSNYEGKTLRDHLYLARPARHAWRQR